MMKENMGKLKNTSIEIIQSETYKQNFEQRLSECQTAYYTKEK